MQAQPPQQLSAKTRKPSPIRKPLASPSRSRQASYKRNVATDASIFVTGIDDGAHTDHYDGEYEMASTK